MAFETLSMPRFRDFGRNHEILAKSCIFPLFLDRLQYRFDRAPRFSDAHVRVRQNKTKYLITAILVDELAKKTAAIGRELAERGP